MATAIMRNTTVSTSAVWSFGLGPASSMEEDEYDCGTPVAQLEASRSSAIMTANDDDQSPVAVMEQEEDPISRPSMWWTYAVGSTGTSSRDLDSSLSARFTPIVQPGEPKSSEIMLNEDDEESSIEMIEQRQDKMTKQVENVLNEVSSPTPSSQSSNSWWSPLESKDDEETRDYEDFELPLAALEDDEETFDDEDFQLPLASSPNPNPNPKKKIRRRHSMFHSKEEEETFVNPAPTTLRRHSYSEQWDSLRLTPTNLLHKMMPEQVKEAQAIIKHKQEEKRPSKQRSRLYKMSRSECRSKLKKSLCFLDALDMDCHSSHTSGITSVESWCDNSIHQDVEVPPLEEKKKWGMKSLFEDLKKGTKTKKKKKKSISKKSAKKNETDEVSKTKKKKKAPPKRSTLEKCSSAPDSLDSNTAASLKAVKNEGAKKKKDMGTKRSALKKSSSSPDKIGAEKKKKTKDKKKRSKRKSSSKSGKTDASKEGATISQ